MAILALLASFTYVVFIGLAIACGVLTLRKFWENGKWV